VAFEGSSEKIYQSGGSFVFALYRIIGLARPEFHVKAFAKDVNHNIVFPWDN